MKGFLIKSFRHWSKTVREEMNRELDGVGVGKNGSRAVEEAVRRKKLHAGPAGCGKNKNGEKWEYKNHKQSWGESWADTLISGVITMGGRSRRQKKKLLTPQTMKKRAKVFESARSGP